jgi:hypothetical protein
MYLIQPAQVLLNAGYYIPYFTYYQMKKMHHKLLQESQGTGIANVTYPFSAYDWNRSTIFRVNVYRKVHTETVLQLPSSGTKGDGGSRLAAGDLEAVLAKRRLLYDEATYNVVTPQRI